MKNEDIDIALIRERAANLDVSLKALYDAMAQVVESLKQLNAALLPGDRGKIVLSPEDEEPFDAMGRKRP